MRKASGWEITAGGRAVPMPRMANVMVRMN
jgi:hypothetical protein